MTFRPVAVEPLEVETRGGYNRRPLGLATSGTPQLASLRSTEWIRPGLRQYRDMQMDKDVCSKSRTEATGSEARRHGRCKCEIGQGESSLSVEGTRRNPTVREYTGKTVQLGVYGIPGVQPAQ